MQPLSFNREKPQHYGKAIALSPLVRRIMAPNAGPLTFSGTATHIIGHGTVAIIDPGPADPVHISAIMDAVKGETVSSILATHTHEDHTAAIEVLAEATGARVAGCAPHFNYGPQDTSLMAAAADAHVDYAYAPDYRMENGDIIEGDGWTLEAVATAGHTANHLSFALHEEHALFSGDHVMGWSTTVIAPPVGNMRAYLGSLLKLLSREETLYYPAHGMPVPEAHNYVRQLLEHRYARHEQIIQLMQQGITKQDDILHRLYPDIEPKLEPPALMTIAAHIEMIDDLRH